MKQKKLLIRLSMLLMVPLILSCEKDLYDDAMAKDKVTFKSNIYRLSDLKAFYPEVYSTYKQAITKPILRGGPLAKEMYGFDVDTASILYLEKEDGYKSYTFEIKELSKVQDYLDNLVISTTADGKTEVFHVKYDLYKTIDEVQQQVKEEDVKEVSFERISLTTFGYRGEFCASFGIWIPVPNCTGDVMSQGEQPGCFNSDGTRAEHLTFVGVTYCSGPSGSVDSAGPTAPPGPPPGPGPAPGPQPGGNSGGADPTDPSSPPVSTPIPDDGNNDDADPNQPISTAPWAAGDEPPTETPCEGLKDLSKKANLKPNIDWLKSNVNNPPNDREWGVEMRKENDYNTGDPVYINENKISPNNSSIRLAYGDRQYAVAHSHPKNGQPMFSFADVVLLRNLYLNALPSALNMVTMMLVCKNDEGITKTYSIKVDNIDNLVEEINLRLDNPAYADLPTEENKVKAEVEQQAIVYKHAAGQYEKSFLQQFSGFGISLYSAADEFLLNWDKLDLGTNPDSTSQNSLIVIPTPCN